MQWIPNIYVYIILQYFYLQTRLKMNQRFINILRQWSPWRTGHLRHVFACAQTAISEWRTCVRNINKGKAVCHSIGELPSEPREFLFDEMSYRTLSECRQKVWVPSVWACAVPCDPFEWILVRINDKYAVSILRATRPCDDLNDIFWWIHWSTNRRPMGFYRRLFVAVLGWPHCPSASNVLSACANSDFVHVESVCHIDCTELGDWLHVCSNERSIYPSVWTPCRTDGT